MTDLDIKDGAVTDAEVEGATVAPEVEDAEDVAIEGGEEVTLAADDTETPATDEVTPAADAEVTA